MNLQDAEIKSVKATEKGQVEVVVVLGVKEFVKNQFNYELRKDIETTVSAKLAETIFEKHGKEITKIVLKEVNWPELVRSKVVRKTIQEISRNA